ncbi:MULTISPECIES: glycosyltransferase family 4 protein [unclassified Caballeronia]|uniref:glycosyltransferase family 4 protein n=1 Tax=unclassified Caballeronia TaxID=2646786 RepID=UPI00285FEFE7|nr:MULTISPECIES: glycosyltransferase family 4 protein [unclassified Caballeronia]MDR5740826.1 glycosyltransferase family 4 protein [Caballeronia sp. LZ016]MDR5808653.1 glycosyltransferase family 4 protein [Caballeronia sp. LZ019]
MEVNEFSREANGGTELMLRRLHRSLDAGLLAKFQIIPSRIREIDPHRKTVLWLHDVPTEETVALKDAAYRKQFARIVMVSDWQMQMFHIFYGMPYSECIVIRNGIEPIPPLPKPDLHEVINVIYHTTPQRGLQLLVPAFEHVLARFGRLHLHVYSSFDAYGQPELDAPYAPLFEHCRHHPNITYHGFQPYDAVRRALQQSHVFAYPSIWPETSCLAAIEAMSAGNLVVAPNYGGLFDTCNRCALGYQWTEKPADHVAVFADALSDAVVRLRNDPAGCQSHLDAQKGFHRSFL